MAVHRLAGRTAPPDLLVDVGLLRGAYPGKVPTVPAPASHVSFGHNGHTGSSLLGTFNETHVVAITQAVCEYREQQGITGPLFLARDTHALSEPAFATAFEVIAANGVSVMIDSDGRSTPTPAVSHAILTFNAGRTTGVADGILVTPSGQTPEVGGLKYCPPGGGAAGAQAAGWIEDRANQLLSGEVRLVVRIPFERARRASTTHAYDYVGSYVDDLGSVLDMDAIRRSKLRVGIDPLGGASLSFWAPVADRYGIDIEVVNPTLDPTFRAVPVDWDGRIRIDCTSPYAMAALLDRKECFDVAAGSDAEGSRHGIVSRTAGLMRPQHYLAAAIAYLFTHRPGWRPEAAIGKSVVTSSIIDRVAGRARRPVFEVPVGFKWFGPGLRSGSLAIAADDCGGASFVRRDGTVWTTERDGILMALLAAEVMACAESDPAELCADVVRELGEPVYERIDAPASAEQKAVLRRLTPQDVKTKEVAGDPILALLTEAPGNGASFGGLKVSTKNGWFAVRPSDTEALYRLYAESFRGRDHFRRFQMEALIFVSDVLAGALA
jgi:phosphoglucomutase